jgi:hypothetical protein
MGLDPVSDSGLRFHWLVERVQFLTQTNLDPGNCLQTCVACILDLPMDAVPDQLQHKNPLSYLLELREFLRRRRHVTLTLATPGFNQRALAIPEYILFGRMVGPLGGICEEHCVVGCAGEIIWDPYPGRPGLNRIDAAWLIEGIR